MVDTRGSLSRGLVTESQRRGDMCSGRRRRGGTRSGKHALLDDSGRDGRAGQDIQAARESIAAPPAA